MHAFYAMAAVLLMLASLALAVAEQDNVRDNNVLFMEFAGQAAVHDVRMRECRWPPLASAVDQIGQNLRKTIYFILQKWLMNFNVGDYEAACAAALASPPSDKYTQRIHDSRHAYHSRDFVHNVPPIRHAPPPDCAAHMRPAEQGAVPWLGRPPAVVPTRNRDNCTAALESDRDTRRDGSQDGMRVIFIKAYKVQRVVHALRVPMPMQVAGTTTSSVFARLAVTRGWKTAPLYTGWESAQLQHWDLLHDHANFKNGAEWGGNNCYQPLYNADRPLWCGGYQPCVAGTLSASAERCRWMDYYIPRAWRVVMVEGETRLDLLAHVICSCAEPVKCISSMYYFDNGWAA